MSRNQMILVQQQLVAIQNQIRTTTASDMFDSMTHVKQRQEYSQRGQNTQLLYTLKTSLTKYLDGWLEASNKAELKLKNQEDALQKLEDALQKQEDALQKQEDALQKQEDALQNTLKTLGKYKLSVMNSYRSCLALVAILEEASSVKFHNSSPAKERCVQSFKQIWIVVDEQISEIVRLVEDTCD